MTNDYIDRLEQLIKFLKVSKIDFAKDIGVSPSAITHWLQGITEPSPTNEKKIALAYPEINVYWLWGTKETMTRKEIRLEVSKTTIETLKIENQYLKEKVNDLQTIINLLEKQKNPKPD